MQIKERKKILNTAGYKNFFRVFSVMMFLLRPFQIYSDQAEKKNLISVGNYFISYDRFFSSKYYSVGAKYNWKFLGEQESTVNYPDPSQQVYIFYNSEKVYKSYSKYSVNIKYYPFKSNFYISGIAGIADGGNIEINENPIGWDISRLNQGVVIHESYHYLLKAKQSPFLGGASGYRFEFESGFFLGTEFMMGMREKPRYEFQLSGDIGLLFSSRQGSPTLTNYLERRMVIANQSSATAKNDFQMISVYAGCRF